MSITIIKPGMLSSFQDRGREGYQHQGIPAAGAMDERAHRLANALAGNSGDPATLEMTLTGPTLRFDAPACFALAGADLGATLNGQEIPQHRPLVARAGDTLAFGARPANGVRGYLAAERTGDEGLLLSQELRTPSLAKFLGSYVQEWRFYAFAEGARLRLHDPLPEQEDEYSLASVGLGTRASLSKWLSGSLDWGYPLLDGPNTQKQDSRLHFSVQATF